MDDAALSRTLQEIGWSAKPHGEATYRVLHDTSEGELVVYVRLTDNWLIASVVPFLTTRGDNSFELARWLLRMNRDMYQCKFAYDEDGDVVLTVELPTESLDFGEIEAALQGLLEHAVEHRATLRQAAG
ncbi:MAG TPA: YbjN domain-containing protein [Sandaracinaceae bacterium LLY-WYZ-13_1]|nr:YbjN domain-containing protein [Sandaracinaceae bacterium LLY-WYZ-13_1]